MAKRTGYSRSYLGNVETGERQVTPELIRAYEQVHPVAAEPQPLDLDLEQVTGPAQGGFEKGPFLQQPRIEQGRHGPRHRRAADPRPADDLGARQRPVLLQRTQDVLGVQMPQ